MLLVQATQQRSGGVRQGRESLQLGDILKPATPKIKARDCFREETQKCYRTHANFTCLRIEGAGVFIHQLQSLIGKTAGVEPLIPLAPLPPTSRRSGLAPPKQRDAAPISHQVTGQH